jgi:hypothetical protein
MKHTLINYRMTTQNSPIGFIKVLLTVILAMASLQAFGATNRAPVISGTPVTSVVAGKAYAFQPTAKDADGNKLSFSINNKPGWASFSTSTGRLNGTPGTNNIGTYNNIVISVSDGKVKVSLPAFSIQVTAATTTNRPPVISGTPITSVKAGIGYAFWPSATDADGNTLTFRISNKPVWASFSTSTGRLSGIPATGNVGTYGNIVISVSDGKATASLPAFSIRVNSATTSTTNRAPVISGTPATSALAGSAYAFQPSATDADGNTLSFGIGNKPAWASFNTSTGRLSGTPATGSVGTFNNIVISVSDGKATASLPAFSIKVNAATTSTTNRPPVISGTPAASVVAGNAYAFQPSATDADGNALTFSISNKPAWATFSTANGRLSGTPATGNVGTYGNIVISATDGKATASLPAFSIQVNSTSVQTGTVTLSWAAPTKRADGTPLSLADIDGYRIHYGKTAGNYTSQVNVADGTAQKVNLTNLPTGTYYLVMTTYDVTGRESGNSSMVTKSVP